ncbi:unnamed protein product [Nesidiocoris tenuis]|uniref:C2H2-type domain-containing protein n=1 Tax=Nesidiocoris tenuis TaxID=355587 RepID=A0A6H5G754_9HEMI|nr:unnamed protein product [Nesidiocoris tenuis]
MPALIIVTETRIIFFAISLMDGSEAGKSGKYQCSHCEYATNHKSGFSKHEYTHTGVKPFKCTMCNYRCREANNLRDHLMMHNGEKPHKCGECGYRCTQASNLKTHMRVHTGFKPYVCGECAYKTTRAGNLKDHMRTHTGERPYPCPKCDYRNLCFWTGWVAKFDVSKFNNAFDVVEDFALMRIAIDCRLSVDDAQNGGCCSHGGCY